MFGPTRALLLALAAILLATQTNAQCTKASYGILNANAHYLQRVILSPGQADWDVEIPSDATCRNINESPPVGVVVTVCDSDLAPSVHVPNSNQAIVHRFGALLASATVDMVVYCSEKSRDSYVGVRVRSRPSN